MVCGTCQATFAVKLKLTRVSAVPSNLQEVRWLAKHCPSVEVVRLHMADGSGAGELQAIETCNPAASFDRVRQLGVSGNHSNLPEWVFWILSHSSNLQLLKLDCISLPLLPVMCQLKHVMLTIHGDLRLDEYFSQIGQLKCLETLAIQYTNKYWNDWEYDRVDYAPEMAPLDLRACPHLSALNFEYIAPADLDLPPGCTTHISYDADVLVQSRSWSHVSLRIIDASCPIAEMALPQLLNQPHQNLTSVQIVLDSYTGHLDFQDGVSASTMFGCLCTCC